MHARAGSQAAPVGQRHHRVVEGGTGVASVDRLDDPKQPLHYAVGDRCGHGCTGASGMGTSGTRGMGNSALAHCTRGNSALAHGILAHWDPCWNSRRCRLVHVSWCSCLCSPAPNPVLPLPVPLTEAMCVRHWCLGPRLRKGEAALLLCGRVARIRNSVGLRGCTPMALFRWGGISMW